MLDVTESTGIGARLRDFLRDQSPHTTKMTIRRNQSAYSCGGQDRNVYFLESGRIKSVMFSRSGKECLLRIHTPGNIFGELCSHSGIREESAIAMCDSVVHRMSYEHFMSSITTAGVVDEFISHLTRRLAEQQQSITHLVTVDSEQRLGEILLDLARKLGRGDGGRPHIAERITHEELAGMVGTTRSRVGHFLKGFRNRGLVEVTSASHLVIDQPRLAAYLASRCA